MKLHELHVFTRLGIALLVVILLGGYVVSGLHMKWHYDSRDGIDGLSINDIKGHYHGVQSPSPLIAALESGHPDDLPEPDRNALLEWLASGSNLSEGYDDLDLGDEAPAEIIATFCLDCHSRGASGQDAYPQVSLEYWDDIQPIAYATNITPAPKEIIAVSQHTHAPTMAVILLVLALLGGMTRATRFIIGGIVLVGALGLLGDMSAWWLARGNENWVYLIVVGGFMYGASTTLVGIAVILDCIIPAPKTAESNPN
ncbi:MAG: hypothetical protein AB8F26_02455 [Phycisphaerales bacterium]